MANAHQLRLEKWRGDQSRSGHRIDSLSQVIILQNPIWGGAERSLAESLLGSSNQPLLICSAKGDWTRWAETQGFSFLVIPRPSSLDAFSFRGQTKKGPLSKWFAICRGPWDAILYAIQLQHAIPRQIDIRTLGIKSHLMGFLLLPWWKGRWEADVRDFIEPLWLRSMLAFCNARGWMRVVANSQRVAADFSHARIEYPRIRMARPTKRNQPTPRKVISHLAFFAPYKGQRLFLECAADWIKQGLDSEFWVIGSVIYPAPEYVGYENELRQRAAGKDLEGRVRFISGQEGIAIQSLLEQTDLLLHCSEKPEPFGRSIVEALAYGAEVICHRDSGVCELGKTKAEWPQWLPPTALLSKDYVALEWTDALSECVIFDDALGEASGKV